MYESLARFVAAIGPRPHHADTHLVALVNCPSTNHLQTAVHHDAFSVLRSGSIIYIWDCYSSHTSTRPCPPTFGEKRRLQHSTCTLWIRSAFVLGVWTWCLEQSASSALRHRCCLHLQASLKVWTLLSSLRRFAVADNWDNLHYWLMFFYWRYVCFLHF